MESNDFRIPLNGLTAAGTEFERRFDKEFFESFGNADILDADVVVRVFARKSGRGVEIDCDFEGTVTVPCDRCLSDLSLPIDVHPGLIVTHEDVAVQDDREVIVLPADEVSLDMRQIVYDYVCLSLPLKRVHADGECDAAVVERLEDGRQDAPQRDDEAPDVAANPFAALKNLLN